MSTGLLFHYFASKEELLLELVKLGVQSTQSTEKMADIPPECPRRHESARSRVDRLHPQGISVSPAGQRLVTVL